jgi:5'(3')-deoxyribonucleotidase
MEEWEMSASLRKLNAPEDIIRLCMSTMSSAGFNCRLEPTKEAVENLPKLMRVSTVLFVTSPNVDCRTWTEERIWWMKKHFEISQDDIVFAQDKSDLPGDVFVDDNPNNVLRWSAKNFGAAILWDAPYNRSVEIGRRAKSWKDLIDLAEFLDKT